VKTFTIIYRTGTRESFLWQRHSVTENKLLAEVIKQDLEQHGGHKALVHDTKRLDAIGLPETYDVKA
jgi:hypothetical protein